MLKILYRGGEMKKSLTKLLGISLLAVAMTVTAFPTGINATEITEDSAILTESVEAIDAQEPIETSDTFNLESTSQSNDYPIVLVHGVMGWGRSEVGGFK